MYLKQDEVLHDTESLIVFTFPARVYAHRYVLSLIVLILNFRILSLLTK